MAYLNKPTNSLTFLYYGILRLSGIDFIYREYLSSLTRARQRSQEARILRSSVTGAVLRTRMKIHPVVGTVHSLLHPLLILVYMNHLYSKQN